MSRASKLLYNNCLVVHPETNLPMFRTDRARMEWYLKMKLAEVVSEDPPTIRLLFKPKGIGHLRDPYFLQEFKNQCVVCGGEKELSHHHVVPAMYRRYFPKDSYEAGRWMYDVLLVCIDCHESYEDKADSFKAELAREYDVPKCGKPANVTNEEIQAKRLASAIYMHGHKMPAERRLELEGRLKTLLGKETIEPDDLLGWKGFRKKILSISPGQLIAEKIVDFDDFAIRWRQHFIKHTQPKYLPSGWNPERRIYSEPDAS